MRIKTLLVSLCIAVGAMAQYTVSGYIVAESSRTPIDMATVRLFSYTPTDSTFVQGCQSGMDGFYLLTRIQPGEYKVIISSVGFKEQVRAFRMDTASVELPVFRLEEDIQVLQEVNIQGHAAEMTVKGDTIEYNTSAYKVSENAVVEDLLKKMNGVTVDKEGNVTVNGETIKGVRIDGKKFFGDDVQSATKNIPAEMVEKIQVIDEKSDIAKLTGFEDDETERIINLSLKKDRKRGVFGNYTGGLGSDLVANPWTAENLRYNANIFTNILLGESQTTIIGGANNTNEIRSGRGRGPFSGQNSGITRAENIGINTNLDLNKGITPRDHTTSLTFGGDVLFNHSDNDTRTRSTKDSYTASTPYHNTDSTTKRARSWDAMMRLELEYQIDTLNKIIFQPRISYTQSTSNSANIFQYQRDSLVINDGYQNAFSKSEEIGFSLRTIYNHKFLHPGRSLTFTANVGFNNTKGNSQTYSFDNLILRSSVDQYTHSGNNAVNYSLKTSYVEPLFKTNHLLELALTLSGKDRASNKDQYSMDSVSQDYRYDSVYSNRLDNHLYTEQLEVNYRWINEKCDLLIGLRGSATQTASRTYYGTVLNHDTLYNQWNWAPNINFKYKFGRKEFSRLIYRGSSTQPTITQMEPVRNNSDALNESVGNLGLHSAYSHNLRWMYSRFNQERFSSIMTGIRASVTKDALVSNAIYDQKGKRYLQTVNAQALPWNIGGDFMANVPFCKKMFQFHTRTAASYKQNISYVLREQATADIEAMLQSGKLMLGDESRTANAQVSEDLQLRFTHSIADVGLRGEITYSFTNNSLQSGNQSHTLQWGVTGDVAFHLPKSWNIRADCGYTARYGFSGLKDVNEILLNATIDKTWGNGTLSLKAYDILHQKKNIVQVVSENAITYQQFNTLPTYIMLSFTYKLNKMGSLKAKGMAGHIQEMVESGVQPGQPPMGPPPMGLPPGM